MTATPSGVELWLVDIARAGTALSALEETVPRLSDDERLRAAELKQSGEDWRRLRIALRLVLERAVGLQLRRRPFRIAAGGKPALPWAAGIEFSLSHSGRHGLIAIASGEVGVDLEQERCVRFPPDRQRAMRAAARALVSTSSRHPPAAQSPSMLQVWVRLEAWGKARGSGVGALLHDLGVRGPGWAANSHATDIGQTAADLLRREGFSLHDLELPLPLYGALAAGNGLAPSPIHQLPSDPASLRALAAQPA